MSNAFGATLGLDTSPWVAGLDAAASSVLGFGSLVDTISSRIQDAFDLIVPHIQEAFNPSLALQAATSYDIALQKMAIAFGGSQNAANSFVQNVEDGLGRGALATTNLMTRAGLMFDEMGMGQNQVESLSETVVKLAENLAAAGIAGGSEKSALAAVDMALVGNSKSLRSMGVDLTQATVKQELMKEGFKGTIQQATEQQLVIARLNVLIQQLGVLQGTAAAQTGTYVGDMRAMQGAVQDTALEFGNALKPAVVDAINVMGGVGNIRSILMSVADVLARTTASWIGWAGQAGSWFEYMWLKLDGGGVVLAYLQQMWVALTPLVNSVVLAMEGVGNYLIGVLIPNTTTYGNNAHSVWTDIIMMIADVKPISMEVAFYLIDMWPRIKISALSALSSITESIGIVLTASAAIAAFFLHSTAMTAGLTTGAFAAAVGVKEMSASIAASEATVVDHTAVMSAAWAEAGQAVQNALTGQTALAMQEFDNDVKVSIASVQALTFGMVDLGSTYVDTADLMNKSINDTKILENELGAQFTGNAGLVVNDGEVIATSFQQVADSAAAAAKVTAQGFGVVVPAAMDAAAVSSAVFNDSIAPIVNDFSNSLPAAINKPAATHTAAMSKMQNEVAAYTAQQQQELLDISKGYNWADDGLSIYADDAVSGYNNMNNAAQTYNRTQGNITGSYYEQLRLMRQMAMGLGGPGGGVNYGIDTSSTTRGTGTTGITVPFYGVGGSNVPNPLVYGVMGGPSGVPSMVMNPGIASGIPYFGTGGWVGGSGHGDSIPAMVTPGEFVVNRQAAATNASALTAMNSGRGAMANVNVSISLPGVTNLDQATVESTIMPMIQRAARKGLKL